MNVGDIALIEEWHTDTIARITKIYSADEYKKLTDNPPKCLKDGNVYRYVRIFFKSKISSKKTKWHHVREKYANDRLFFYEDWPSRSGYPPNTIKRITEEEIKHTIFMDSI